MMLLAIGLAFGLAERNLRSRQGETPPVYGQIHDFALTNQNGAKVKLADLRGHPWVADIIFTRCAGQCPRMTQQMKALQEALPADSSTRLVSLTTDPDYDTPRILRRYGERFGADTNRWMFLTGTKQAIGKLATGGLKLSTASKAPAERNSPDDLFVHSTVFAVVDGHARLRGFFQTGGTSVSWPEEKQRILDLLSQLETGR